LIASHLLVIYEEARCSFYFVRSGGKVEITKGREEEKGKAQSNVKRGKGVLLSILSVNLI
jgi:hypothetical protein